MRTFDRISRRGLALLLENVVADVPYLPLPDGVRIAPFAGPDWTPFLALTTEKRLEKFRKRIARGRECLVAWRDERPVGFTWISRRMDPDIETYALPLPADAAYHWDLYVASAERGSGLGTALANYRLQHTRDSYRLGWRLIDVDNGASQKTAQRTASPSTRVLGELRYLSLGGRSWSSFTPEIRDPRAIRVRDLLTRAGQGA